jgi:hypothetical protein
MDTTKKSLLQGLRHTSPGKHIAGQQAIVDASAPLRIMPIKTHIPGGQHMLKTLTAESMKKAVYTWLRRTKSFTKVTISMAKDPAALDLQEHIAEDFPHSDQKPWWKYEIKGRKDLANKLAKILSTKKLVTLTADGDSIKYTTERSGNFGPTRKATKSDIDSLKALLKKGETPDFGVENGEIVIGIGDSIPNEQWEPYVELTPERKRRDHQRLGKE